MKIIDLLNIWIEDRNKLPKKIKVDDETYIYDNQLDLYKIPKKNYFLISDYLDCIERIYTNVEVMELLKQRTGKEKLTQEILKEYYKFPVMCLLRIKESIDTWEKRSGADGYFDFIEGYMGDQVNGNEMNFALMNTGSEEM